MQQTLALFLAANRTDVDNHHEKMLLQMQLNIGSEGPVFGEFCCRVKTTRGESGKCKMGGGATG